MVQMARLDLVGALGFRAIDAGALAVAWLALWLRTAAASARSGM
jgi:hypothetical protein